MKCHRYLLLGCTAATSVLAQDGLEPSTPAHTISTAVEYFRPEVLAGYPVTVGGRTRWASQRLAGDLIGPDIYWQHGALRLEGIFRTGELEGTATAPVAGNLSVDRTELDFVGSWTFQYKSWDFSLGVGYNYVSQDYELLPTAGGRTEFADTLHNFYVPLVVGYRFSFDLNSGPFLRIDLVPKALGALGLANMGDDSNSGLDVVQWYGTYRFQGTVVANFVLPKGWDVFVEGGYRWLGTWNAVDLSSVDLYGPYGRAGIRYSF